MEDRIEGSRKFRMLVVIDEFTRESLAIEVAWSFTAHRVVETLQIQTRLSTSSTSSNRQHPECCGPFLTAFSWLPMEVTYWLPPGMSCQKVTTHFVWPCGFVTGRTTSRC